MFVCFWHCEIYKSSFQNSFQFSASQQKSFIMSLVKTILLNVTLSKACKYPLFSNKYYANAASQNVGETLNRTCVLWSFTSSESLTWKPIQLQRSSLEDVVFNQLHFQSKRRHWEKSFVKGCGRRGHFQTQPFMFLFWSFRLDSFRKGLEEVGAFYVTLLKL